jgi:spermidine/putrescine-binding protein
MNGKKAFGLLITMLILSSVIAACAQPTPEVIEKEVIVREEVPVTVEVEKEVVVEKKVVETVEVEKEVVVEKVVTPTPEPKPELAATIRVDGLTESSAEYFDRIVLKPFCKEMGVEIELVAGTYGRQEEWLASIQAAPGEYCIATYVSDLGVYNGITGGLLQPLRLENIPNYSNLADIWEDRVFVKGDENAYYIPVSMGMYTFVYAKDKISEQPDSYAPLFDPQYADRIALRDYGLYRIFQTAAYLGLDPSNLSEEDVDLIFDTMTAQRDLARAYWQSSSQLNSLLANREVWVADYWFSSITMPREDGTNLMGELNIGWWFPKEGGPVWVGGMAIAAGCEGLQRYTAELLLNYLLEPEVYTAWTAASSYIPAIETDLYDEAAYFATTPYVLHYRDAILNTGILLDYATILANQDEWNERYEEMKLGK